MHAQLEPTSNPCGEITVSKLAPKRPKSHSKNPWTAWSNGQPSHVGCLSSEWPGHPTPTPGVRAPRARPTAWHITRAASSKHITVQLHTTFNVITGHDIVHKRKSPLQAQKYNLIWFTQTKGKKETEAPQKSGIMLKICWQENIFREKNTNPFTFFLVCL